jgi:hypothetical protein
MLDTRLPIAHPAGFYGGSPSPQKGAPRWLNEGVENCL